jgi:LacI family transcriptional regulator
MHTMKDVARLAGVSVATVSAVINGTAVVSPARAKRVREAMEALDYHPDQVARSLRTGLSRVVGMIVPDITNPFYPEVILGVEDAARKAGYSVILCNSNEDPAQEKRHLNELFARRVDGVLIACSDVQHAYDRLLRRWFPLVFFDRIPDGLRGAAVSTDNVEAGYIATRHLVELGHERIAMISGSPFLSTHQARAEGFRKAMQEAHLPIRAEYLLAGGLQIQGGYDAAVRLLGLDCPPTAIFSSNNRTLLGLVRAIGELGICCPEQISVVGFDDFAWTANFHPQLTTVVQPTFEMGSRAMETLLAKIKRSGGEETTGELALLAPRLQIRQSTAPAPVRSRADDRFVSSALPRP